MSINPATDATDAIITVFEEVEAQIESAFEEHLTKYVEHTVHTAQLVVVS